MAAPRSHSSPQVRVAAPSDGPGMSQVWAATIRVDYRGLVSDEVLERMVQGALRGGKYEPWLAAPTPGTTILVAAEKGGVIVGYVVATPAEEPHPPEFTGEIGAIYVLPDHQRQGIGRRLFSDVMRYLGGQGHSGVLLWTRENRMSRKFYEAMGGRVVDQRTKSTPSGEVPIVAYGWNLPFATQK